jgi:hypothetical protein
MSKKPVSIIAMKDSHVDLRIPKEDMFDLPMRVCIVGKSQLSGKSTMIGNLVLRPFDLTDDSGEQMYKNDFKGKDIYIVCPSFDLDEKMHSIAKGKMIPEGNIYREYNEEQLMELYNRVESNFNEAVENGRKPVHSLIILDDCAFAGSLKDKMNGVLTKIACNGRHILMSMVLSAQRYTQVSTVIRENVTGAIFFEATNKQLELISEDHCSTNKKLWEAAFRKCTQEKHGFFVVNYSNPIERRFQNSNFETVSI